MLKGPGFGRDLLIIGIESVRQNRVGAGTEAGDIYRQLISVIFRGGDAASQRGSIEVHAAPGYGILHRHADVELFCDLHVFFRTFDRKNVGTGDTPIENCQDKCRNHQSQAFTQPLPSRHCAPFFVHVLRARCPATRCAVSTLHVDPHTDSHSLGAHTTCGVKNCK